MIQIEHEEIFGKVIAESLARIDANAALSTHQKNRWINAAVKAVSRIETSGSFMTWQPEKNSLLIWSDSNLIYEVSTVCQCQAAFNGQPCWHLAAKRLVELYVAAVESRQETLKARRQAERDAMSQAPYLSPSLGRAEKIGSIRI